LALRNPGGDDAAMSIWTMLMERAAKAFDLEAAPEPAGRDCLPDADDLGFTAAVIGLAAKMARADGLVTRTEASAAAKVFQPPPGEEEAFSRVFALAHQTVLGFESYARQIGKRYRARPCLLEDVLDGLFHIAAADGALTPAELSYLRKVADQFGFSDLEFRRIKANNLGPDPADPYAALGLLPGASLDEVRQAWRRLAAENHPDRLIARGAPAELVRIAQSKTAAINAAYECIRQEMDVLLPSH
jgi:DnaJ like chaperone protein